MTQQLMCTILAALLAPGLFSYQATNNDSHKGRQYEIIEISSSLDELPEDILEKIFLLTKDFKSDSLPHESQLDYRIHVDNLLQTFDKKTIVSILPFVNKKFNKIITNLRNKKLLPYKNPVIHIPLDPDKIESLKNICSDITVGLSVVLAITSSGIAISHVSSFRDEKDAALIHGALASNVALLASTTTSILTSCGRRMISSARNTLYGATLVGSIFATILYIIHEGDRDTNMAHYADIITIFAGSVAIVGPWVCMCLENKR